ncbi:MAG: ABC transporter permease [Hyphomicrobiaceae bacterium]
MSAAAQASLARQLGALAMRYAIVLALVAVIVFFSIATPTFLVWGNIQSVLLNNFTLMAIVAIAMTLVVSSGGLDLSVGTAVDMASLTIVTLILSGYSTPVAVAAALLAAAGVGLFNAILISGLRITPFLATLGTLFIGRSAQQLLTGGGNPIYLPASAMPESFKFIGHGQIAGLPVPIIVVIVLIVLLAILMTRTRYGRSVLAIGVQARVAVFSGVRVSAAVALVSILAAFICGVAGIVLSATVSVYVPYSGNAFLLNAIGATFIGTTLHPEGRPNILGTILGVLLLSVVGNGLLLIGLNFYWQQVGTGILIFLVLAASFAWRPKT